MPSIFHSTSRPSPPPSKLRTSQPSASEVRPPIASSISAVRISAAASTPRPPRPSPPHIPAPPHRLTVVVADGLSALAATRHALPLLLELRSRLSNWTLDSVVLATGARVALADQIGEHRGSEAVVILLGERPGLSSTDSLGIYLTYAPRPGRTEAERNCISNVRREGLSYAQAASKLLYLLDRSRLVGASGVLIKDGSDDATTHWPLP